MSIFSVAEKLPNRFTGGFLKMGAVTREPRTNTPNQLIASIKVYGKENSEIAEFAKHLNELNPKHLGLAQDIIDLSRMQELLPTNINMLEKHNGKQSIMGFILEKLPNVSKKNPAALDLTEAVINNSDTTNAKYFLAKLFSFNLEDMGNLSAQMNAVKEIIPNLAKDILEGGYTMDFSKNKEFFQFIQHLCSSDSKPENIKMIKEIIKNMDSICKKVQPELNLDDIRMGDTETIRKNLEILPSLLENAERQGSSKLDVSGFLTKNVNLN